MKPWSPPEWRIAALAALLLALLVLLAATGSVHGQTPPPLGTVSQVTTSTVTATAGSVVCALTYAAPPPPAGVHTECKTAGVTVLTLDSPVPAGTNGMVGKFAKQGNLITWTLTLSTSTVSWQISANGTAKTGTFCQLPGGCGTATTARWPAFLWSVMSPPAERKRCVTIWQQRTWRPYCIPG